MRAISEAYSQLLQRYGNAVYALAYSHLHNFEDARDVAQEAFVAAYVRLGQLREPAKFGAWLRQITVNQCHYVAATKARLLDRSTPRCAIRTRPRSGNACAVHQSLACLVFEYSTDPHTLLHALRTRCRKSPSFWKCRSAPSRAVCATPATD
jgi:hypothetical protein